MNYFKLAYTTPEVLKRIRQAESEGRYNEHLDPIDYENCYPVEADFPYIPKGRLAVKQRFQRIFPIAPFCEIVNRFILKSRVYGKEKLSGIESAVVTCNHINKLDAVAARWALRRGGRARQFKVMVADFNNQKGKLGEYMRSFGIMPFCAKHEVIRRFEQAVQYYLQNDAYILFFPEQSEWWCYEKPRPIKDGAFYYAVKNRVPVVPLFITFSLTGCSDKNNIPKRRFHVHVLEPIYAREDLSAHDNIRWMRDENYREWTEKYEEFYKRKL